MRKVKFEDIATRVNTREDKDNTSLLYYVGGDHIESGEMVVHNRGLIAGSTIGPMFYFGFKKGDILLVSRNPHLRKAAMVNFDGICSEKTFVIGTKDESVLLQRYLAVVVQTDSFWNYCEEHKSGGVNFFVNWSTLAKYEFELPDIVEQRIISDKVWAAYEVKESYRKLISATEEIVKSRFFEMFGDPFRNDKGWEYNSLSKITTIVLGTTPSSSNPDYWDGDIKWITPVELNDDSFYVYDSERHITEAGVRSAALKSFPAGTVIFSTRAPIGKTAIAGCEMYCNQGFKNFICSDKLNPVYLLYTLKSHKEELQKMGTGSTFLELSKRTIEGLSISTPPRALQDGFEVMYKQADKSKFELKQAIEKIDKVMRALMQ